MAADLERLAKLLEDPAKLAATQAEMRNVARNLRGRGGPELFDDISATPSKLHLFLEGRVPVEALTASGKDKPTLLAEIAALGVNISSLATSVVENPAFTISSPKGQPIQHVVPTIRDLGTRRPYITTVERDARAMELDLEPQTGGDFLEWVLKHESGLKLNQVVSSSHEPVTDSDGNPRVLYVWRDDNGVWLDARWVDLSLMWIPGSQVAFRLRQSSEPLNP